MSTVAPTFRRVIVAFDGSPRSEDALVLAVRLCDPGGVLTLACVVTGQRWHVGPQVVRADAPVPEEIALLFADARHRAIPSGIHVRERAPVAPSPARGLVELAEKEGADLIVVGSSAHGEAGRIRLERTAGRLLDVAPCAVAIAPGGLREGVVDLLVTDSPVVAEGASQPVLVLPRAHEPMEIR